ncbi:hypothetical protein [Sphingomonas sp.]|uniref:hypothetical protein n=1 Tax=Sphingomonas sp. TaxID=28214 RepID=UPI0025E3222B|nr:hypothetical protein [Sphingomonas sp.]
MLNIEDLKKLIGFQVGPGKQTVIVGPRLICVDCGRLITGQTEPADGWELEDGRIVCGPCCAADLRRLAALAKKWHRDELKKLHGEEA